MNKSVIYYTKVIVKFTNNETIITRKTIEGEYIPQSDGIYPHLNVNNETVIYDSRLDKVVELREGWNWTFVLWTNNPDETYSAQLLKSAIKKRVHLLTEVYYSIGGKS